MDSAITGLHHITAIAGDPQRNVDFYAALLGLRLIKKTVNFDDPSAYHIYYGDETGTPGSIVTFFYWPGFAGRGRVGAGESTALVFSAPPAALPFWRERLAAHGVPVETRRRFGEEVLVLADPDGIPVEIVAVASDARAPWTGAGIPAAYALRGLHTFALTPLQPAPTERLLTGEMGFRLVAREKDRARFETGAGGSGHYADMISAPGPRGRGGVGSIHHVAWNVPDDDAQASCLELLETAGYQPSPVIDRDYFHSIYYRERGGILFEIATAGPGFAIDEEVRSFGSRLCLPRQFESARDAIEQALPPLRPARWPVVG
jgi:glyoxalase family protein